MWIMNLLLKSWYRTMSCTEWEGQAVLNCLPARASFSALEREEIAFPGLLSWAQSLGFDFWEWNPFSQFPVIPHPLSYFRHPHNTSPIHACSFSASHCYLNVWLNLILIANRLSLVLIPRPALSGSVSKTLTILLASRNELLITVVHSDYMPQHVYSVP